MVNVDVITAEFDDFMKDPVMYQDCWTGNDKSLSKWKQLIVSEPYDYMGLSEK